MIRSRGVNNIRQAKRKQLVKDSVYRALSDFRQSIHNYLDYSDHAAKSAGIEPRQYQLMLAIKGLPLDVEPTVGRLAERLRIRHHSAVELIDRTGRNGFVQRERSANGKYVLVQLTSKGFHVLEQAVAERLAELQSAGPILVDTLRRLLRTRSKSRTSRK